MSCCCPHSQSAGKFFSFFARRYRKRFQKKGFEPSQKQLMEGIRQAGFQDASILEIGSGVGHLHQTLLEQGARKATGVDLAPNMIKEARQWAADRNLADRVSYIIDDFVTMDENLTQVADITVLDKVICCYPDANALVHKSLAKTRRVYAVTYPRKRLITRIGEKLAFAVMWLIRSSFRSYVHDPDMIEAWITEQGYNKLYENKTVIWLTQVYVKNTD